MFQIDFKSGVPIYTQIKNQVVRLAFEGELSPGEQLPSVRGVARELGINPNTVAKAYQELEAEGIIYSVGGKGSFLSEDCSGLAAAREPILDEFKLAAEKAKTSGAELFELRRILDRVFDPETEKE